MYFTLRGDFFLRERGTTQNLVSIGNVAESSFSMTRETVELKSTGNTTGTLASEEVSKAASLSMMLNALTGANMARALYGTVSAQAAATAQAFTLPVMAAGEAFRLGRVNVSNVAIPTLVEGVDYRVLKSGGVIVALKAIPAGKSGTFDCAAASAIGVFTHSGKEYEVVYVSEGSGKTIVFNRWKPNPAQAFALISNDFASFQLEGPVLLDDTIADGPLGRFAVVYDAR